MVLIPQRKKKNNKLPLIKDRKRSDGTSVAREVLET
jgi:hypothetical protein